MEDKGTVWLPVDASTMAGEIDSLFYFTYWVSIVIFVAVIAAILYFVVKYRRKHPNERTERVHESHLLEAYLDCHTYHFDHGGVHMGVSVFSENEYRPS